MLEHKNENTALVTYPASNSCFDYKHTTVEYALAASRAHALVSHESQSWEVSVAVSIPRSRQDLDSYSYVRS